MNELPLTAHARHQYSSGRGMSISGAPDLECASETGTGTRGAPPQAHQNPGPFRQGRGPFRQGRGPCPWGLAERQHPFEFN